MRLGYKHTEAGLIPEEWEVVGLQQACREAITYGIVQCGPHIRDGVPYIRVSDMDTPELSLEGMLRTSKAIASRFARSTVEEGDLVYALRGKLGEVRQVRAELVGANLTQGTARLSPNDRVDSDYLVWAMRDPRAVRQAELEAKGTTFREITLADLRRIRILVPPKAEQRTIAAVLGSADALLGGLDLLIAKKRDLKQAATQQLLTGQTRLPGFRGEWGAKRLGDIADVLKGRALSKALTTASGMRSCILYGELFTTYGRVIRDVVSRTNSSDGTRSVSGDVLLPGSTTTTGADLATASALLVEDVAIGGDIIIVRGKGRSYDPAFLARYLTHTRRHEIAEITQGITIHHLYGKDLRALSLQLPSLPEQIGIAAVLWDVDAELAALEARRDKTRNLKQAMMQELLTGKTRLVPAEADHA